MLWSAIARDPGPRETVEAGKKNLPQNQLSQSKAFRTKGFLALTQQHSPISVFFFVSNTLPLIFSHFFSSSPTFTSP